ncbi:MAG: FkbM family methyltransferase [Arenicella sp.]|jgi:FkbM family methyltransferase
MNKINKRNFWFHKYEFLYYRIIKYLKKEETPTKKFIESYISDLDNLHNVLFGNKFYYDPFTDIGNVLFFEGEFEKGELELTKNYIKDDSFVLDIGANIGHHSVYFAQHAKKGRIFAFEPSPTTYQTLLRNIAPYPQIQPMNFGVGKSNQILSFYETEDNAYSSYKNTHRKEVLKQTDIACFSLDSFLLSSDLPKVDFVKIDVEGFEQEVLEGMQGILEKFKPVVFCEIVESEFSNPTPLKTIHFMQNLGYEATYAKENKLEKFNGTHDKRYENYFFLPK